MMRNWFSTTKKGHRSGIGWLIGWIVGILENAVLVVLTVLLVWALDSRKMSTLEIWHTTPLTNEFTSGDATPQSTLQDYLEQEARLFDELRVKIYNQVAPTVESTYSRYRIDGPQDPAHLPRNWNRTFELVPENIQGGALLFHGLSDSPYSLRRMGEILYEKGFYVLGLRLPGHGTIPGALTEANWKDWVAASRIAARHVGERIGPDKPFVIAGYSNGGALTAKYSLDALSDPDLPPADRLLLFSPEIGITAFSAIANFHKLLSFIPYFAKFKWLSIQPEYDPKVTALQYRPDAIIGKVGPAGGLYQYHSASPPDSILIHWVEIMPVWARDMYFDHALWQWIAMMLTLLAGVLAFP